MATSIRGSGGRMLQDTATFRQQSSDFWFKSVQYTPKQLGKIAQDRYSPFPQFHLISHFTSRGLLHISWQWVERVSRGEEALEIRKEKNWQQIWRECVQNVCSYFKLWIFLTRMTATIVATILTTITCHSSLKTAETYMLWMSPFNQSHCLKFFLDENAYYMHTSYIKHC